MSDSISKIDRIQLIANSTKEFGLFGPSNADCELPPLPERITVSLRNSAADADVIIKRVPPNGLVFRQYIDGGTR